MSSIPLVRNIEIFDFKAIRHCRINLKPITLLFGGNNSGKSSIIEAINFVFSSLQSAYTGKLSVKSLFEENFLYVPTKPLTDIRHGAPMTTRASIKFLLKYQVADNSRSPTDLKCAEINFKKGKNRNIQIVYDEKDKLIRYIQENFLHPFSLLVPGISGIPVEESYAVDFKVRNRIVHGDCNLYIRNVLYRIAKDSSKKDSLLGLIKEVFPHVSNIQVEFNEKISENILATVEFEDGRRENLERVGLGLIQAIQILSYYVHFKPPIILLDEPDAHLHPNNQRKIMKVLDVISSDGKTTVIACSHSRFVLSYFLDQRERTNYQLLLVSKGCVKSLPPNDLVSVMLDIGALDQIDGLYSSDFVILTEDDDTKFVKCVSECYEHRFQIIPFHGKMNLKNMVRSLRDIRKYDANAKWKLMISHIDSDGMLESELLEAEKKLTEALKKEIGFDPREGWDIIVWFTRGSDIESMFLYEDHLRDVLKERGYKKEMAEDILNDTMKAIVKEFLRDEIVIKFIEKRGRLKELFSRYNIHLKDAKQIFQEINSIFCHDSLLESIDHVKKAYEMLRWIVPGKKMLPSLHRRLREAIREDISIIIPTRSLKELVRWQV